MRKIPEYGPRRRITGDIPPPSAAAAAAAAAAPRVLRLQAVITTDGRLTEPVVLAGSAPGVTYEILENLRGWRYEPAQQRKRPVAVFRNLTVQLPAGAAGDGQIARVEGLVRSGSWGAARDGARGLWYQALEKPAVTQREIATLLMLRALAEAGLGMEAEAVCRWQAAQYVEPQLQSADLSAYGSAGQMLERTRGRQRGRSPATSRPGSPGRASPSTRGPPCGCRSRGRSCWGLRSVRPAPSASRSSYGWRPGGRPCWSASMPGLIRRAAPSPRPWSPRRSSSPSAPSTPSATRLDPEPANEALQRVVSISFFSAAAPPAGNPLAAGAPGPVTSNSAARNPSTFVPEGQNRTFPLPVEAGPRFAFPPFRVSQFAELRALYWQVSNNFRHGAAPLPGLRPPRADGDRASPPPLAEVRDATARRGAHGAVEIGSPTLECPLLPAEVGDPGKVDRHWENYWRSIEKTGRGGQVLWDNEPERARSRI